MAEKVAKTNVQKEKGKETCKAYPEEIAAMLLCIISIILIINTILVRFFNMGTYQSNLALVYCIAFILLSIKYKNILSKKYVTIPLYILIIQTAYSLITK